MGYAARAKGVRGEVFVHSLTWRPERFGELARVVVEKPGAPELVLRIEGWRPDGQGALVKFAGIDSPEAARDAVVKGYLTIPRDEVADLPADTYYVFDVVGCQMRDEEGHALGEVTEVLAMPAADVYVVRRLGGGEAMVPAVRDFVLAVDVAGRQVIVRGVEELFARQGDPAS